MSSVDWGARPDQIEGLALREVGVSISFLSGCAFLYAFTTEICSYP